MIISVRVRAPVMDAYLYAGHLFAVFANGAFRSLSLNVIYDRLLKNAPGLEGVLKCAFLRNDWLGSEQAKVMLGDAAVGKAFRDQWRQLSKASLAVEGKALDGAWEELATVNEMPVYDLRMYAMRAFLSHRRGVDELRIHANESRGVQVRHAAERVFEARALEVAPRWGGVAISADSEGLFHGSLHNDEARLQVSMKPLQGKSLRCTWANFNLVNYSSRAKFAFLCNRHEKLDKRAVYTLADEESERKIRITEMGARIRAADEFMGQAVDLAEVAYAYNSNSKFFIVRKDGRVQCGQIKAERELDGHLSRAIQDVGVIGGALRGESTSVTPSSVVVNKVGSHLEYFDRTLLIAGGKIGLLHSGAAYVVKVFPTSRRFQATTLVVDQHGLHFYIMLPPDLRLGGPFDEIGEGDAQ
jgi:hypothetical protein